MTTDAHTASSPTSQPQPLTPPLAEAVGLYRRMGQHQAVHDLSLTLRTGDIVALLGLNGAGKSTTLKMLSGILTPDQGHIHINSYNMAEEPLRARSQLGFLADHPPLYDHMRVGDYLCLAARIRGLTHTVAKEHCDQVISECDLQDKYRARISSLSKGYRQRVGLAQAIVHRPPLILLDEPSSGLDPQQLEQMRALIKKLSEQHAIVLSTHLLSEAQASCNRVMILHQGRLTADRPATGDDLEVLFKQSIQ